MIKKNELIANLSITSDQAQELIQALIPIYHTHQTTRKIIEWLRRMRELEIPLSDQDIFIWIHAIQKTSFTLLQEWEEENQVKVNAAQQRSNWR